MEELAACELVFVVVPSMHVPSVAPALGLHLDGRHLLVHVSRGLIGDGLETVSRHLSAHTPARRVGCLAGPINPEVLAQGLPGGGVVGTGFPEVAEAVREAIGGATLRLYETDDTVGVEVASALVGLLALAAGFCLESRISPSALAVMMSRGLEESARVGVLLGARRETFHGLAGAGDLYAAIASDERAEVRLGRALAHARDLETAGREAGAYIEGITIARRVARYAARMNVDAPIARVMADVLEGQMSAEAGLGRLMLR
jgi:glycerol-3-phosphate dehydrogenase (NAD(P)+)